MSDFILQWSGEVDRVVRKLGKGKPAAFRKDMRQEAFLALLENETKLMELVKRNVHEANRFAYTAARNRVSNLLRDERVREHPSLDQPEVRQVAEVAEIATGPPEDLFFVRLSVDGLPVLERLIITLLYGLEGKHMTEAEAAQHLGISRRLLSDHKQAALKKLRARIIT